MFRTLTTLLMACATLFVHPFAQAETAPAQKAVLVTGASSGLGRVMAEATVAKERSAGCRERISTTW